MSRNPGNVGGIGRPRVKGACFVCGKLRPVAPGKHNADIEVPLPFEWDVHLDGKLTCSAWCRLIGGFEERRPEMP